MAARVRIAIKPQQNDNWALPENGMEGNCKDKKGIEMMAVMAP